ncbi:ran-binding protein 3 isoform X2 [Hermetia illucens]|nr:ran-binding protein 3 isoform X2 [Hermetia illucens]
MLRKSELSDPVRVGMLRPSLFKTQVVGSAGSSSGGSSGDDLTKPSSTADPGNIFLKVFDEEDGNESKREATAEEKKEDSTNILKKNCPNMSTVAATTIPLSDNSSFVFGQNIHERVLGENIQKPSSSADSTAGASAAPSSSSDTGLLFSSALNNVNNDGAKSSTPKETDSKSLSEVARVYEESRAQKRKYDEVETFTGEEEEINIVEFNCKLFAFINGNWEERGRGMLRLNDAKDSSCSRVVFRTSGNLRLLVNTKIWPEMVLQRPSQKSLRITAMDNMNQIKIFLIMSRPDDITLMHDALLERINSCKRNSNEKNEQNGDSSSSNGNKDCEDEPSPKKPTLVDN